MQKCRRGWLWKLNCTDQCIVGGSWEMCRKQFRLKTGGSLSFSLFLSSFLSFFLSLLLCFCWHELSVIIDLPSGIIDVFLRSVSIRPRFLHPPIRIKSADMSKLVDEAKKKIKRRRRKMKRKWKGTNLPGGIDPRFHWYHGMHCFIFLSFSQSLVLFWTSWFG